MVPLKRRCPRCGEVAEFGRTERGGGVRVHINLVPVGTVHAPAGTLIYACSTCGNSFKLLPKYAYMLFGFSGIFGIGMLAFILQNLRHADDGKSVMVFL